MLLKSETATDVRSFAPIARSLHHMDKVTEEMLKTNYIGQDLCENLLKPYTKPSSLVCRWMEVRTVLT